MKKNSFFRAGMSALALMFVVAVIGCDTGNSPGETLPELPVSAGTNELGGKTAEGDDERCVFNADGTFTYSEWEEDGEEDGGVWTVTATGAYSWNSGGAFKTVTLGPQRAAGPEGNLLDKAGWKAAARAVFTKEGLTEENVEEKTKGEYTTIAALVDAYTDYAFALLMFNYTMSGETVDTFVRMVGAYGYANAKGGKVVVENNTSGTLTVTTYAGYAGTEATTTVSSGETKQVFTAGADTFLTKINLTASGNIISSVGIHGRFSGSGSGGPPQSSYETKPVCVGGGETITVIVD
jgi:hypothetical protein